MAGRILRGVHAGFGECLGPAAWDQIATWGADLVRIGVEPGKHTPEAILEEMIGRPFVPVICVDLALEAAPVVAAAQAAIPGAYFLELGNEPMIREGFEDPRTYAEYVRQQVPALLELGLTRDRICVGSLLNAETDTVRWLERFSTALAGMAIDPGRELLVSFHRYAKIIQGRQAPAAPHEWHRSRAAEWAALTTAADGRPLVCTEFGFDTGIREWAGHAIMMRAERQAAACRAELARMREHGVPFAIWYQLNDGPTAGFIDRYGLRAADGTPKPALVAALFDTEDP